MLKSLTKKEQGLLVAILFSLGLGVSYYMYVFTPKDEQIVAQRTHVESLNAANTKAASELKAGNLRQLKDDALRYAENLEVMRQLVPTVNEVPGLLEQVSNSARTVGLDIAGVTPQPVSSGGEGYDAHRYRLVVKGGFNRLAEFMANVGSLPRIVTPTNVKMKLADNTQAAPNPKARRGAPASESVILTEFDIETYVARSIDSVTTTRRGGTAP
jgi:type IV pilus assembly protein PilO